MNADNMPDDQAPPYTLPEFENEGEPEMLHRIMLDKPVEHGAIFAALSKAQGDIHAAEARMTADAGSYSYKYADLAACLDVVRKPLAENELALVQLPSIVDGEVHMQTILGHSSGQSISCTMAMRPDKGGPQAIGATMTYLRRYSLSAMLGVAQYDDDAASATKGPDEYDRLRPRDIDEILVKADELFEDKADFVIQQMVEKVFGKKYLNDVPADQLKTALRRLDNTYKREQKKEQDKKKAAGNNKPKPKPPTTEAKEEPGADG